MKIVLVIIALVLIFIGQISPKNKHLKKIIIAINFLLCVCLLFSMREISPDYNSYKIYYNDAINNIYFYKYEIGFRILNKGIYVIAKENYNMVFLLYFIIMMVFYYKGVSYYCKNSISIGIVTMLFIIGLSDTASILIRQFVAVSVLFYASKYILEKNKKKLFMFIVLATLIHMSSVVFLIAFIIYEILYNKEKRKFLLISLPITAFVTVILLEEKIKYKINKYYLSSTTVKQTDIGLYFIFLLLIFFITIMVYLKKKRKIENMGFIIILGFLYYIIFLGMINLGFTNRLALFFNPFVHVAISKLPTLFNSKSISIMLLTVLGVVGVIVTVI